MPDIPSPLSSYDQPFTALSDPAPSDPPTRQNPTEPDTFFDSPSATTLTPPTPATSPLTPRQHTAISLLTSGETISSTAATLGAWTKEQKAVISNLVLDKGGIGRSYGARTTPHMYVIDPAGKLVYAGAIDSKPSSNADDIPGATNSVIQALDELAAGKPVSKPVTQPYGCTVKYDTAT